jgi:hypothetical protein
MFPFASAVNIRHFALAMFASSLTLKISMNRREMAYSFVAWCTISLCNCFELVANEISRWATALRHWGVKRARNAWFRGCFLIALLTKLTKLTKLS